MDALPTTNATKGASESTKNSTLETGASMVQNFAPPKRLCAHLNAFHAVGFRRLSEPKILVTKKQHP
jgi:hypothetical protein